MQALTKFGMPVGPITLADEVGAINNEPQFSCAINTELLFCCAINISHSSLVESTQPNPLAGHCCCNLTLLPQVGIDVASHVQEFLSKHLGERMQVRGGGGVGVGVSVVAAAADNNTDLLLLLLTTMLQGGPENGALKGMLAAGMLGRKAGKVLACCCCCCCCCCT